MVAILTGDIVGSSKMDPEQLDILLNKLRQFLDVQKNTKYPDMEFEFFRGDSVQIKLYEPEYALTLAAYIRAYVISMTPSQNSRLYDIRISVGIGDVNTASDKLTTSTGQAFVFSGHALDRMKNKERFVFKSSYDELDRDMTIVTDMLTVIINHWTLNRTKIVLEMLLGTSREDICRKFNIGNPTLSTTLTNANYSELKRLLEWAEIKIKRQLLKT
jgi:hypothetical protein